MRLNANIIELLDITTFENNIKQVEEKVKFLFQEIEILKNHEQITSVLDLGYRQMTELNY